MCCVKGNTEIKSNLQKLYIVWATTILIKVPIGLLLDSKLTFNKHIDCICKEANLVLAFVGRNTHFCQ